MGGLTTQRREVPGRSTGILAAILVLVATAAGGAVSAAPAAAASSAGGHVQVSGVVLWPNPADDFQPRSTTVTYAATTSGTYQLWVTRANAIWRTVQVGKLVAGQSYQWEWNGRGDDGTPVERGDYRVRLLHRVGKNSYEPAGRSPVIAVHNGTQRLYVHDRRRERGAGPLDLSWFTLVNSPGGIKVAFDFRHAAKRDLGSVTAALDVDHDWRGYLVTVQHVRGGWKTTLTLARLASDAPYHRKVRCPKLTTHVSQQRVVTSVPRSCLKVGGAKVRANFWATSRDLKHSDHGPDQGSYWTRWVSYERPPA